MAVERRRGQKIVAAKPGFDLVMTDLDMPEMDGLALIEWIRQYHHKLPVFLLSGRDLPYPDVFFNKGTADPDRIRDVVKALLVPRR